MAGALDRSGTRDAEPGLGTPAASGRSAARRDVRDAGQSALCSPSGAGLKPGAGGAVGWAVCGMWARPVLACVALCACARAWLGGSVCAREAAGADGARYVAFLNAGTATGPALVESVWAAPGRLRACWARRDPRLARAFRAACAQSPPVAPGAALRRALSALWRRRAACTDSVTSGPQRRRRRGWTLPGTLWCGAGNSAGNWSELGTERRGAAGAPGLPPRGRAYRSLRRALPRPRPVLSGA